MPLSRPFRRILVANRGEIALRICRAAHELGCETVAVFSPDDGARALHARCATQAVPLTPGSATGPAIPYLHQEQLLEVARDTGCDAVHPGYGFLSESAAFARRVCDGGLTWIGPPPAVLTLFGDKTRARALAQQLALPVIRGSPGSFVDAEGAFEYIRREGMGWPVLLKAAHGGGGRGIRLVAGPAELPGAFAAAAREAEGAFGAGELFVEEVVSDPRHIEVLFLGPGRPSRSLVCLTQRPRSPPPLASAANHPSHASHDHLCRFSAAPPGPSTHAPTQPCTRAPGSIDPQPSTEPSGAAWPMTHGAHRTSNTALAGLWMEGVFFFHPMCLYSKYSEFCGEFKNV